MNGPLRNVHVHFTTAIFLTLYMYVLFCFNIAHAQLDNFSTLRLLEHMLPIRIPFCFFHSVSDKPGQTLTGKKMEEFFSIMETLYMNC